MSEISTLSSFARMVHCGWAAPELDEQLRSKESDIFSFACTVYEVFIYFLDLLSLFVIHIFLCEDVYPTTSLWREQ